MTLAYQSGFGNEFATEAVPGALAGGPQLAAARRRTACTPSSFAARRSPRRGTEPAQLAVPHPPGRHARAVRAAARQRASTTASPRCRPTPNQLRWTPLPQPGAAPISSTACSPWPATARRAGGVGIHLYAANRSMDGRFFYNADGELLIVPQQGRLRMRHRTGRARVEPQEIARDPARRPLPRRAAGRQRRAATCARTSARCCACRIWARSAPTAWPTRATS